MAMPYRKTGYDDKEIIVIGIGASAGGLASIEKFFKAMKPDQTYGAAFVIVQHLDPNHKSILMELVKNFTSMQVYQIVDGITVKKDTVYIIPENHDLAFNEGKLHLMKPSTARGSKFPIDQFFRSLATAQGSKSIGIIFSGAGTDGTLGLKEIKAEGGIVFIQTPESAEFDSMPRSALQAKVADYIMTPQEMPSAILRFLKHEQQPDKTNRNIEEHNLFPLLSLLRDATGHSFHSYKKSSLLRRVERRMIANQIETIDAYTQFLTQQPSEIEQLFKDLLIGVTNFFRDPEAFDFIKKNVLPEIFSPNHNRTNFRFWSAACSTGEEAYSLSIIIHEYLESTGNTTIEYQVFATDIDIQSIEKARLGIFPDSITAHVSQDRLEKFFIKDKHSYRLSKKIRDSVIFAKQDLIKDPPFSKIDLICCRNLLIYFEQELQKKVISLFNFALNQNGYLFLGNSESLSDDSVSFSTVNKKWKIFKHNTELLKKNQINRFPIPVQYKQIHKRSEMKVPESYRIDIKNSIEKQLQQHFGLPAIVFNKKLDILYLYGKTGPYLEPANGMAFMNLNQMIKNSIKIEAITLIRNHIQGASSAHSILIRNNKENFSTQLSIFDFELEGKDEEMYLLVIKEIPETEYNEQIIQKSSDEITNDHLVYLERELQAKEEYLKTAIEELETSNEELKSTNEELQSANEELQSSNEELETSKEELQSVNEELTTVNQELQRRIDELSDLNNDVNNLFAGTGIATIFVDENMVIRRFTPSATDIVHLIPADVGRPLNHIASDLVPEVDFISNLQSVLDTLVPIEKIVENQSGKSFIMRIQPYRSLENVVSGAVLTFVELNKYKI